MGDRGRNLFVTAVGFVAAFAGFAAPAQEGVDEFEPAVDTSVATDELDALEPAATGDDAIVAQDATRWETDSGVMDEMALGLTEITGNQELPKVLYIVPWQKAQPGELAGRPVNTLLDEVLAPLDREEFTRQVDYYGELYGEED